MVPPKGMCRRHLLGEHVETHMFLGTLQKGRSVAGFLRKGLLEPSSLKERHDLLAVEMEARGYKHSSPMDGGQVETAMAGMIRSEFYTRVDAKESILELYSRCMECSRHSKS